MAFNSLKRAFDPDAPLFIDYEEHLSNYVGTNRAPVEHEAVRYRLGDAGTILLPLPEEPVELRAEARALLADLLWEEWGRSSPAWNASTRSPALSRR